MTNQNLSGLLFDLDSAIADRDPMRHVRSLKEITNLFVSSAGRLASSHAEVYDAVMLRLLDVVGPDVRARVAQALAPLMKAPAETLGRLASDTISVAGPVLQQSPALATSTLVDLARRLGQEHLLAIAGRPALGSEVTDVLVVRGDAAVLRTTAGNPGASFSDLGFGILVERSAGDPPLQRLIGLRADLPPAHLQQLIQRAADEVRVVLLQRAGGSRLDDLDSAVAAMTSELEIGPVAARKDYAAAADAMLRVAEIGKLNEDTIALLARSGRRDEVICGLSALTRLPLDAVEAAFAGEVCHGVVLMVRALGFGWPSARRLLRLHQNGVPSQEEIKRLAGEFERMKISTARRALGFLVARPPGAPRMAA